MYSVQIKSGPIEPCYYVHQTNADVNVALCLTFSVNLKKYTEFAVNFPTINTYLLTYPLTNTWWPPATVLTLLSWLLC